jgi:hypothetical protein
MYGQPYQLPYFNKLLAIMSNRHNRHSLYINISTIISLMSFKSEMDDKSKVKVVPLEELISTLPPSNHFQ